MEADDWKEAWQAAELADSQREWPRSAAMDPAVSRVLAKTRVIDPFWLSWFK